jgi:hypothetical protein
MDIFTVENTKTGEFRTFKVREQPLDASFAPGKRVISLLVGRSNSSDYQGFGFQEENGGYLIWKRCRGQNGDGPSQYEKIAQLLTLIERGDERVAHYRMLEAIPCRRCGELLTVPESILSGIGPVCARKE